MMYPHPASPSSSDSSSSPIHMFDHFQSKVASPNHLYVRQPHAIQIIQLVEGPPPPRRVSSVAYSSSYCSSASSCPTSSSDEEDEDDCTDSSSYCSSYVSDEASLGQKVLWTDETHDIRMKRVTSWRDVAAKALAAESSSSSSRPSLKRKAQSLGVQEDSPCSKRSRSPDGRAAPVRTFPSHACPACDTPFYSPQALREHGRTQDNEACRVAVDYDFE
ncbi:hypothetical protein CONPUDRAFT_83310 [Coniophora puteana RWD-64-598 SS2]|uniref:Uncharacterized protein n=1 Tax=Coniophora puteana (strain RWD-64-598) TaxID=741705 RepID=A0A5M3MJY7_CONPW|nr:uncharacterized protein CONPUDRAFT_83310 [Coniophora puteana RWD-64-598 SS2]EIW78911.1 hypothetical protein CONPUDRAFT_83310 [Coniophora puteana RWD-64-598 SS2]